MREDFPAFLLAAQSQAFPDCDGIACPVFVPDHKPVSDADLDNAEQRLALKLPASFRTFLRTLGSGSWCGDDIAVPQDLEAFDSSVWGCGGFVQLVCNVNYVGDRLCINPADMEADGERPVYFCAHDPFGQAWVAHSFEDWCRATVAAMREQRFYYDLFSTQLDESWRAYKKANPWWKFW